MTIDYPSVESISPTSLSSAESPRFTLTGAYCGNAVSCAAGLISPFQNPPSVSDSTNACVGGLSEYSFNYPYQTVTTNQCELSANVEADTDLITVNNGFRTGTATLTVKPIPPTPLIFDGLYADNQCNGTSIANPSGGDNAQTVVVGQLVQFTACMPPTISTTSVSWQVSRSSLTDAATAGFVLAPTSTSTLPYASGQYSAVSFPNCGNTPYCDFAPLLYFLTQGTYNFTYTYTLGDSSPSQSATVTYVVEGPTCLGYYTGEVPDQFPPYTKGL